MSDVTAHTAPSGDADFESYVALLKPRVMSLVVFTAAVGLIVAPGGTNAVLALGSILFIALGAGASGALNMWWDADIDRIMKRTQNRPIPAGEVSENNALILGLWMSVLSVTMLGLTANWVAAGLLAFTIFFYAVIYSMWLKRSTPQNIVIGGAAGAFPPMVGWAAATGTVSLESVLMFALIFMWTPPHFWALSLFMNDDYTKAGVPMMTVTHGRRYTRGQILLYTVLLTPVALSLAFSAIGGPIYFIMAAGFSIVFLRGALAIYKRSEEDAGQDDYKIEKKFFRVSLIYLFALFMALLIEWALGVAGLNFNFWQVWG